MEKFFDEYLNILRTCHNDVIKALEGLPSSALDWNSGTAMNSISILVFHLTGAERYWIGDVVAQKPSGRDRDAEFKVHDTGIDLLKKRLDETLAYAQKGLEDLTIQDLEQTRISPRDGREFTVAWSLLHALEHSTLHLGHIQITRQLWEQSEKST